MPNIVVVKNMADNTLKLEDNCDTAIDYIYIYTHTMFQ